MNVKILDTYVNVNYTLYNLLDSELLTQKLFLQNNIIIIDKLQK